MRTHLIVMGLSLGSGLATAAFAQVALKFLALVGLGAGPGPFQAKLMQAATQSSLFWSVAGATAVGVAIVLYLVWGLIRLVRRGRGL